MLVRRCYLNPQVYQRFRPSFNRAGFEIIDCPAMTSEGKTSTDIHMVLDIVDLLQHETHYDEFIVFSADADFTPVLRKLRRWDRRTSVLAIGFPSAAYQASADLLIDPDTFVREALGFSDSEEQSQAPAPVSARAVAPPATANSDAMPKGPDLKGAVVQAIRSIVEESPKAVSLPWLATALPSRVTGLDASNWVGLGGFRRLIDSLTLTPLIVSWTGGGSVRDPRRHTASEPGVEGVGEDWHGDKALLVLARQIHDATDVPLLSPDKYQALIGAAAADLAEQPFTLTETGKRVRDRCRAAGQGISRADVNFTLQGLLFSGHVFGQGKDDVTSLTRAVVRNVLNLCQREQMVVDEGTEAAIARWIGGRQS